MFTDKELKVAKMRLEGLKNNRIAEQLQVSEADISQTLSRLSRKIKTVQDSTRLLLDIGVIQEGPKYVMTETGRKLTDLPKKTSSIPRDCKLVRISTLSLEAKGVVETSWNVCSAVSGRIFILSGGTMTPAPQILSTTPLVPSMKPPAFLLREQKTESTERFE